MTDDLEARLERLSLTPVPPPPPMSRLRELDRGRALRRSRSMMAVAAAAAVALGIGGLAARVDHAPATITSTDGQTASTTASPDPTAVLGDAHGIPIAGADGVAGWVDRTEWDQAQISGPPALAIGTGAVAVRGFEVHDEAGELVGYYLESVGFVPASTAADPAAIDALVTSHDHASHDEAKELHEQGQEPTTTTSGG